MFSDKNYKISGCMHLLTILALTHWSRLTHICVSNLTIIGPDNGLSPGWRQAIIWTNAGILLIRPWGTNFSEILIGIQTFSFKKMHLKMLSAKWRPFSLGLNVLKHIYILSHFMVTGPVVHAVYPMKYAYRVFSACFGCIIIFQHPCEWVCCCLH